MMRVRLPPYTMFYEPRSVPHTQNSSSGKPYSPPPPRSSPSNGTQAKRNLMCKCQKVEASLCFSPLEDPHTQTPPWFCPASPYLFPHPLPLPFLLWKPSLTSATPTSELLAYGTHNLKYFRSVCAALCTPRYAVFKWSLSQKLGMHRYFIRCRGAKPNPDHPP